MSAAATFAEAPIRVRLPPESAPRPRDRPERADLCFGGFLGLREVLYHWDHGRRGGDVIQDAGRDAAAEDYHDGCHRRGAAADPGDRLAYAPDEARHLQAPDEGEKADKEDEGGPLDLLQDFAPK